MNVILESLGDPIWQMRGGILMLAVLILVLRSPEVHLSPRRQNMKISLLSHQRWRRVSPLVFLALTLVLSACDQGSGNGSGSSAGTTKPPVATAATTAGIQLDPQPCPVAVQAPSHWNTIVGTSATKMVEGVICGYLMGVPALQAVVKERNGGANFVLDIDVYTAITSTKPC
jgi:hypothetical protein